MAILADCCDTLASTGAAWAMTGGRSGQGDEQFFISCRDHADETEFANHFDYLKDVADPGIILKDDPDIAERFSDVEEQLADG
jgi:hypothetical protein